MMQVDENSNEITTKFDAWVDFTTLEHLIVLINEKRVKSIAQLEQRILEWGEIDLISKALQRQEFI